MQQKSRQPRLTVTEKVLLALTAAVIIAAVFLLPRGGSAMRQAEETFSAPGPSPVSVLPEDDALVVTLSTRIDVNHASAEELTALPGVGPVLAAAIVDYREEHGPFSSLEELALVSGVGEGTLSAILAAAERGGE